MSYGLLHEHLAEQRMQTQCQPPEPEPESPVEEGRRSVVKSLAKSLALLAIVPPPFSNFLPLLINETTELRRVHALFESFIFSVRRWLGMYIAETGLGFSAESTYQTQADFLIKLTQIKDYIVNAFLSAGVASQHIPRLRAIEEFLGLIMVVAEGGSTDVRVDSNGLVLDRVADVRTTLPVAGAQNPDVVMASELMRMLMIHCRQPAFAQYLADLGPLLFLAIKNINGGLTPSEHSQALEFFRTINRSRDLAIGSGSTMSGLMYTTSMALVVVEDLNPTEKQIFNLMCGSAGARALQAVVKGPEWEDVQWSELYALVRWTVNRLIGTPATTYPEGAVPSHFNRLKQAGLYAHPNEVYWADGDLALMFGFDLTQLTQDQSANDELKLWVQGFAADWRLNPINGNDIQSVSCRIQEGELIFKPEQLLVSAVNLGDFTAALVIKHKDGYEIKNLFKGRRGKIELTIEYSLNRIVRTILEIDDTQPHSQSSTSGASQQRVQLHHLSDDGRQLPVFSGELPENLSSTEVEPTPHFVDQLPNYD